MVSIKVETQEKKIIWKEVFHKCVFVYCMDSQHHLQVKSHSLHNTAKKQMFFCLKISPEIRFPTVLKDPQRPF